ncbi:hypothetical protein Dimus_026906, partial [Dionaea muscipula]
EEAVASPQKPKKRKLVKGVVATKGYEAVAEEKGKDATDSMVVIPVVERDDHQEKLAVVAEKED